MQSLVQTEKSNSEKHIYRGKFGLVQRAHTRPHSAFKPPLNEILVCVLYAVGVETYLTWSGMTFSAKDREVKGPKKANENKTNQILRVKEKNKK